MKLRLPNSKSLDLSFTKVMGTIALEENDTRSIEDLVLLANSYVKAGAELLEIGAKAGANCINETRVISVLCAVMNSVDVPVALNSNNYEIVSQAIKAGVSIVITTNGLSTEGMIDLVKGSEVAVCLHFDPKEKIEDDSDVVSIISEYYFERIDTLLNAGIERKRLLIDPSVVNASVSNRLRLLGRLESFKSFALPICIALPRSLPKEDRFMKDNRVLTLTTALFCSSVSPVQIIRTADVGEVAIAIGFWQIMASKTKPFKLSKTIVRRLRLLRDAIHELRKNKEKN